jgi:hypothetical protein
MVVEPRSTIRAIVMVIPISVIIAVGIYQLISIKKNKNYLLGFVLILYLINISFFLHQYFVHKIYHHPWYSDVGLSEMVSTVNKLEGNYSAVVMAHAHYMPYLFFNKVRPQDFIANSDFYDKPPAGLVRVKRFGKIYFNMPYNCPPAGKIGVLYVCFGAGVPREATVVDVIRYKDGVPAIVFVEFKGSSGTKPTLPDRLKIDGEAPKEFPFGVIPSNYESYWPKN